MNEAATTFVPTRTQLLADSHFYRRKTYSTDSQDIFLYAGEVALSGGPLRLDFHGLGTFHCSAGANQIHPYCRHVPPTTLRSDLRAGPATGTCKFVFAPAFATTFQENLRPGR